MAAVAMLVCFAIVVLAVLGSSAAAGVFVPGADYGSAINLDPGPGPHQPDAAMLGPGLRVFEPGPGMLGPGLGLPDVGLGGLLGDYGPGDGGWGLGGSWGWGSAPDGLGDMGSSFPGCDAGPGGDPHDPGSYGHDVGGGGPADDDPWGSETSTEAGNKEDYGHTDPPNDDPWPDDTGTEAGNKEDYGHGDSSGADEGDGRDDDDDDDDDTGGGDGIIDDGPNGGGPLPGPIVKIDGDWAKVLSVVGRVQQLVIQDGKSSWVEVRPGDTLGKYAVVRTGLASALQLDFGRAGTAIVHSATKMGIADLAGGARAGAVCLSMKYGSMALHKVRGDQRAGLVVETPAGAMQLVAGKGAISYGYGCGLRLGGTAGCWKQFQPGGKNAAPRGLRLPSGVDRLSPQPEPPDNQSPKPNPLSGQMAGAAASGGLNFISPQPEPPTRPNCISPQPLPPISPPGKPPGANP